MKIIQGRPLKLSKKILWTIFFFCAFLQAQQQNKLSSLLRSELPVEGIMVRAEALLSQLEKSGYDSIPYLSHDYAYWLFDQKKIKEAIVFENKAMELTRLKSPMDTFFLQKSALGLGFYYNQDKQYRNSISVLQKVLLLNSNTLLEINAYDQLARSTREINDYYKALEYYDLNIQLLKGDSSQLKFLRNTYINGADACTHIGTEPYYRRGIQLALKADSIAQEIPTHPSTNYSIQLNLGKLYNQIETLDIPMSRAHFIKALEIAKEMKSPSRIRDIHFQLGNLYNTTDYKVSTTYFNQALKMSKSVDSFNLYQIHMNLGAVNAYNNKYKKGIEYGHQGLAYLTGNSFEDPTEIDLEFLIQSENKTSLLLALPTLAETYLKQYETTLDPKSLDMCISYMELADKIIDLVQLNSSHFKSRLFWRELSTDIYGKAIRACFLRKDKEKAFYFMEKNKALLLQQDIASQNFKNSLDIPTQLLNEEQQLKEDIFKIDFQIKSDSKFAEIKTNVLKKERIDKELKLSMLQDSMKLGRDRINLEQHIISLTETQNGLKENEVIIEYHISIDNGSGVYSNNEKGYVMVITANKISFIEIPHISELKKDIINLTERFRIPFNEPQNIIDYNQLSNAVYLKLFPTEEIRQRIKNKHVKIIPDSYLSLLPFEALSTTNEKTNYLIKETQISYLYSTSFLRNIKKSKATKTSFLAFAPQKFNDRTLTPLINSSNEVRTLEKHYNGTSFMNEKATKETFLKNLGQATIIHLATHADAQDSITPWIAFYNEKLLLEELYFTENNASLVFLSGCNTTLGKQEVGEGVISLARGFFYSGSQSVISSLWSIGDRSTSEIVGSFYENLDNGQTKSMALHNAKLSYINNHTGSYISPHYWASFILLGEDDMIQSSWFNNWWILFFGGVLILLIMFLKRFYKV
jgi:CHAT domain-containing protein